MRGRSWRGISALIAQKQCDNGIVNASEEELRKKSNDGS